MLSRKSISQAEAGGIENWIKTNPEPQMGTLGSEGQEKETRVSGGKSGMRKSNIRVIAPAAFIAAALIVFHL